MESTSSGHNATYAFASGNRTSASLIVFNSGSGGMSWGFAPSLSIDIKTPELTTSKSYGTPTYNADGTVSLPITITGLTNVTFFDGNSGTLGPGDSVNVNMTVLLDPNASGAPASLSNVAAASAEDQFGTTTSDASGGGADEPTGAPTVFTPAVLTPTLDVSKSAALPSPFVAGSDITYTITVSNTSAYDATAVTPSDGGPTFGGNAATNALSAFSPASADIAAGTSQAFTATYTLDQSDINNSANAADPANSISNTAMASGTGPYGDAASVTPGSNTTGFTPTPALNVTKSTTMPATIAAGQNITYTVTINNTGNVIVSGISPNDPGPTFGGLASTNSLSAFTPAPVNLGPGTSQVFTATYTLAQTDIDNMAAAADPASGTSNSASANGSGPGGSSPSVTPGTDTAGFTPNGELSASKSATLPATIAAGQSISYTVTLENTGNVTVNGAAPSDSGLFTRHIAGFYRDLRAGTGRCGRHRSRHRSSQCNRQHRRCNRNTCGRFAFDVRTGHA